MKTLTVFSIAVLLVSTSLRTQLRYIDDIFPDVEMVHNQEYVVTISVLNRLDREKLMTNFHQALYRIDTFAQLANSVYFTWVNNRHK